MGSREQLGRGSQVESQSQPLAEFRFPARKDQLQLVRQFVRKTLASHGCGSEYIDSTVLAVDEATTNVIQHAYGPDETGEI